MVTMRTYDHECEEPEAAVGGAESHHEVHHGGEDDGAKYLHKRVESTHEPPAVI